MKKTILIFCSILFLIGCKFSSEEKKQEEKPEKAPFFWENANLYFLLTDRFNNGDTTNDVNFNRNKETAKLRGFEGGDLKGITQKIKEGYFTNLGVNAIWMSPIFEQIHGGTDEGTGVTYGFHGYWTKDWTAIDPNFGTKEDLKELIYEAHKRGIRVLLDAVVNHTGPVTEIDTQWANEWVRTEPQCTYKDYKTAVTCTLVKNLPDVKTESNEAVALPQQLVEKWKKEGRYEAEIKSLNSFFSTTNYPRAPRFYVMKWLADYIAEFGFDGYRVDTVKHVEETVWQEFKAICDMHYETYKKEHPNAYLNDKFYLLGELYGYGISTGLYYNYSDRKVNYFDKAFNSMINFDFKWNAKQWSYEKLFSTYSDKLNGVLKDYGTMNYISSHDDGQPFDKLREKTYEGGTKLLLSPGASQLYYGDETGRVLEVEGAIGDANLRSNMNWEALKTEKTKALLTHFQKLGKFRENHPSIGAGVHQIITESPYVFQRTFLKGNYEDKVVVGLELPKGKKTLSVGKIFKNGTILHDAYSNKTVKVVDKKVTFSTDFDIVLLEKM